MKFAYEDLSDKQFEELVICICQHLLGISVQPFSEGPDGGRDAKFLGVAELHPSTSNPWKGITIIQAKHTNGYNKHFSESDFFSSNSSSSIIALEVPRIKRLREKNELDNYMLFANRRLSAISENEIRAYIATECSIPEQSIFLCGVEQIEIFLKTFSDIPDKIDLDPIDSPLIVSPNDLAEVVQALAKQKEKINAVFANPPSPRIPYEEKNKTNNMTDNYAREIKKKYLKETRQIDAFLAAPENFEIMQLYESVVDEFQLKIISKRKEFQTFDNVMNYLMDLLFNRDPILNQRQHKRLTKALLFYMYWNCDIGEE